MKNKIEVGFDFDGVIAYNPFRLIRSPVTFVKRNIFGARELKFWYPKKKWQQIFWTILHESSVFPSKGIGLLQRLIEEDKIEAHLITARYSFLDDHLHKWLEKHNLKKIFKTINLNKKDEQPHLFKEKMLQKYKLDIFIEDNLDIVRYLHGRNRTKIYWIYNLFDRREKHPFKYPYLEKALEDIEKLLG